MVKVQGQKEVEGNIKLIPGSAPTAAKGVMYYDSTADALEVCTDGSNFKKLNAFFKRSSSTFTDNDTEQTFTDSDCDANTLVTVVITDATEPQGVWSVESGAGSFTITSTVAETDDIDFDYYLQKAI